MRLFIYNTGHGGNTSRDVRGSLGPNDAHYIVQLEDHFDTTSPLSVGDLTFFHTNPDGRDLIQISTRFRITNPAIHVIIDGIDFGPLTSDEVTDPSEILDLGEFVPEPTFTYQLSVPHDLLGQDPSFATIDLFGADLPLDAVAAFTFRGGEQDYIAVNPSVPEPTAFMLLGMGGILLVVARSAFWD
jgi:hypothetical protein